MCLLKWKSVDEVGTWAVLSCLSDNSDYVIHNLDEVRPSRLHVPRSTADGGLLTAAIRYTNWLTETWTVTVTIQRRFDWT